MFFYNINIASLISFHKLTISVYRNFEEIETLLHATNNQFTVFNDTFIGHIITLLRSFELPNFFRSMHIKIF